VGNEKGGNAIRAARKPPLGRASERSIGSRLSGVKGVTVGKLVNRLTAHARNPFTGPRKVAMADPHTRAARAPARLVRFAPSGRIGG
jgi:hypothetical protein